MGIWKGRWLASRNIGLFYFAQEDCVFRTIPATFPTKNQKVAGMARKIAE